MPNVTVVPNDHVIIVDGAPLRFDFDADPALHAIQWRNGGGHVEMAGGANRVLGEGDYAEEVAPFVALWEAEKARLDAQAQAAEAEYNRPENAHKRKVMDAQAQARSMLMARVQSALLRTENFTSEEFSLFAAAELFPFWTAGETYAAGQRIQHESIVYEVIQDVTALENQPPDAGGMLAVYRPLSVNAEAGTEPDGGKDNPFPYLYGMDVKNGSYYSYNGKLYLAKADMTPCVWEPGTAGLWQWELVEKTA